MRKQIILSIFRDLALLLTMPFFLILLFVVSRLKTERSLVWGHTPIINNKYWSDALKHSGYKSLTLMSGYYANINIKEDFDLYFADIFPSVKFRLLRAAIMPWLVLLFLARHASVLHMSFDGGALAGTLFSRMEAQLYKMMNIKTVIIPYGGDVYAYSQVFDPCVRHGLLLSYPEAARRDSVIRSRVDYWIRHADVVLTGFTLEGLGRWDVPVGNMLTIDLDKWQAKSEYSMHDGVSGVVRIMHNPNHTGVKGSEFILEAVKSLQSEGLKIELVLLKGVQNHVVKLTMQEVDIHADQLILPGYGMSAIEAMASGLPVISNLSDRRYTTIFRRYSFLNECPIISATPETIKSTLRALVTLPEMRRELSLASRAYVEKYHSFAASQYLFGSIYRKILSDEKIDLMNLFHPLTSTYTRAQPYISHPLIESRLPGEVETV